MARLTVNRVDDQTVNITINFTIKVGQTDARLSKASQRDNRTVGERTFVIDTITISPREFNALHALLGNDPVIGSAPNSALGLSASLYVSEKAAGGRDLSRAVQPRSKTAGK